jgi:6-phosphogluconate dehydrogenase
MFDEKGDNMKIGKQVNYVKKGDVINADVVTKISGLPVEQKQELKQITEQYHQAGTEQEKEGLFRKVIGRLESFGIGVASSLTASQLFESLRNIPW